MAAKVLGSEVAADARVAGKGIGLGNRVPLEVMLTPEGQLALREDLARLDYGVYC